MENTESPQQKRKRLKLGKLCIFLLSGLFALALGGILSLLPGRRRY